MSVMSLDNTMSLELKTMEYFILFDIKFYECTLFYYFKIDILYTKTKVIVLHLFFN